MSFKVSKFATELGSVLEKHPGLKLAMLFGSYVEETANSMSDVDLLVEGEFSEAKLLMDISGALNTPIERIDLVRVERLPTKVLARALGRGVVVLCRDSKLLTRMVERVAVEYPEIMELYGFNVRYSLDPEDKVDEVRLLDLLNNAIDRSKLLKRLLDRYGVESFERDEVLDSALRWLLYEIVQSVIDSCAALAASLKLGLAESYKDYVAALIKGHVMSEELGINLVELISLRNRLAHRYRFVEAGELVSGARKLVDRILPAFKEWMYRTIEKHHS